MSIATEITDLSTNLAAAKTAVTNKGGTVGDTGLAGLADEIASIPGSTPSIITEPPIPSNCYAEILYYECDAFVAGFTKLDQSIDISINGTHFEGLVSMDRIAEAVVQENPDTGEMYNFALKWDNSNTQFVLYYTDTNSTEIEAVSFNEWDLESYGIWLSQTQFSDDTEIAGIMINIKNIPTSQPQIIKLTDSSMFNELMSARPNKHYYEYEPGSPIPGFIFENGTPILIDFISGINFGENAMSLTSIGNDFMSNCPLLNVIHNLPTSLTSIGDNFLYGTAVSSYFKLPDSLRSIGTYFMSYCVAFNQPLDISNVTSIGTGFLLNCVSFNQPITIPNGITLGTGATYSFMQNCNNMVSPITIEASENVIGSSSINIFSVLDNSVPAYTVGMSLKGSTQLVNAWMTKLPNRTSSPYRKLIVASS